MTHELDISETPRESNIRKSLCQKHELDSVVELCKGYISLIKWKYQRLESECDNGYGSCGALRVEEREARQALTTLQAYIERDGWMPIESAPKDGTEVIVCGLDMGSAITSIWFEKDEFRDYGPEGGWCYPSYHNGGSLYEGVDVIEPQPTHWRPLPTPPKGEES